jgi:hypothetical protein
LHWPAPPGSRSPWLEWFCWLVGAGGRRSRPPPGIAGLLLKGLWFHPWLAVGVLLDLAVTVAALTGPPALS